MIRFFSFFSSPPPNPAWPTVEEEVAFRMGNTYSKEFRLSRTPVSPTIPYFIIDSQRVLFDPSPLHNQAKPARIITAKKLRLVQAFFRKFSLGKSIAYYFPFEAWTEERLYPIFAHNRLYGTRHSLLLPHPIGHTIGSTRFGGSVRRNDIPWEKKQEKAVWRGSMHWINPKLSHKAKRLDLVEKYHANPLTNVAFTKISDGSHKDKEKEFIERGYIREFLSGKKQLRYKYLIVIEGNDAASSLVGALLSNSVVLMPLPCFETIVEFGLKPWEHYIPIETNFSDLEEKIRWCIEHDTECRKIAEHSTAYIGRLQSKKREHDIAKKMLEIYRAHVTEAESQPTQGIKSAPALKPNAAWPTIESEVKYRMGEAYNGTWKLSETPPSARVPFYILSSEEVFFDPLPGSKIDEQAKITSTKKMELVREYLKKAGLGKMLAYYFPFEGMWRKEIVPMFTHNRLFNTAYAILIPHPVCQAIGSVRFGGEILQSDIPWEEKQPKAVWRGSAHRFRKDLPNKTNRMELVEKYHNNPLMNVAFHTITDSDIEKRRVELKERGLLRERLNDKEQLLYKYIIVVEGNDVSSSLFGALLSNSVVLMPHPFCYESIVEFGLEPWKHYIPIATDFSDLEKQVKWCMENDAVCKKISQQATAYIGRLADEKRELEISKRIIDIHKKNTTAS